MNDIPTLGGGDGVGLAGYSDQFNDAPCVKCCQQLGDQPGSVVLACSCGCGRQTPWHRACLPPRYRVHVNAALSRAAGQKGIN